MKTAIYIEDGVVQLVLTPETEFEKNAMSGFADKRLEAQVFEGTFYDCRGGWTRQSEHHPSDMYNVGYRNRREDQSIILRVEQRSQHIPREEQERNLRSMEEHIRPRNTPPPMPTAPQLDAAYDVRVPEVAMMAAEPTHVMHNAEMPMTAGLAIPVMEAPNEMPRLRR